MFRVGIMGAGHIAEKMSRTLNALDEAQAYAIASRDKAKAERFAAEWGFEKSYGSYEELVKDEAVDMVYVATPHSCHFDNVMLCLRHRKPVLCEKSFMMNAKESGEILEMAAKEKVFVAEAIWTRYMPSRQILEDIIKSGEIGDVKTLTAHLGYPITHKERVMKPELGGGALLDLGVYCINFAYMHIGNDWQKISSSGIIADTGVDIQETITMLWEDGRMASLTVSATSFSERQAVIAGDKGYVIIDNVNNPLKFDIYSGRDTFVRTVEAPEQITGFEYEVRSCIDAIRKGKIEPDEMPHSEIQRVMETMDTVRAYLSGLPSKASPPSLVSL